MAKKPKNRSIKTLATANNVPCWSNDKDVELACQRLTEMFVGLGQVPRIDKGQQPAQRAVFRKQHGIAYGHFIINPDIDPQFKIGIFAGKEYECAVRFSSDTLPSSPDLHSTLGLAVKLFGVDGPKLIGEGDTADFIFQNMDRFFTKNAQQMCQFTTAGVIDKNYDAYLNNPKHIQTANILQAMQKVEASCLSANYWAILPFKLGEQQIVKYRLVPEGSELGAPSIDNNYLALDLQRRLRQGSATFRFEVQLRTNPKTMPLDDAQAVWSCEESPYVCIARLHLAQQNITAIGQAELGNNLAFNIWRTLAAHEPLGSIALARKSAYAASAHARHTANGQQLQEPKQLSEFKPQQDQDTDSECIVYAGIYPPIGVMRVGNSKKGYFIGPQQPQPIAHTDEYSYRDKTGALKRQAAEFRIYGFNAAGKAIKELTLDNADITWHAELANQKACWYEFQIALDIPEAADAPPSLLRNNNVADRSKLLIKGGKHSISGKNVKSKHEFIGQFMDQDVYLGEMRSDQYGRLLMLGGHGVSRNVNGDIAITFANNEGWYDDTSDGPITAEVVYQGISLRVEPAWVICAPPDYAPMQKSVRTMWDLMRDVAVDAGMLARPQRPSFSNDIQPIFDRMTDLQWVNDGFAGAFGWGGQFNYTTNEWLEKLSDPSPAYQELRRTLSNNFRRFDVPGAQAPQLWPWLYGDAISIPPTGSVRQHATLSNLQLSFLDQWVKGDFINDYTPQSACPAHANVTALDDYPIAEQPELLTRGAMEFCLADAFHPGCEMTWPMRTAGMYMSAFRLKHAQADLQSDRYYYGPVMNSDVYTLAQGPLFGGQVAGGITRWMAIPWQTDTASCRDGYSSEYDPFLPTFWPARVPNQIMNQFRYQQVLDTSLPDSTRQQAFAYRTDWLDDLPLHGNPATYTNQINSMIDNFAELAIVQPHIGVIGDAQFPSAMQVGILPNNPQDEAQVNLASKAIKHTKATLSAEHASHRSQTNLGVTEKASRFHRNKGR
ncbi:lysine-epsilon oxidase [Pseudoalteromonas sp. SG41-5]|uniref:LodA/GoxA family CTQ-dependent oxidase n=1 Tax=Pseudoalteromonas sp. SG41-5 TaxID=2760975 RepID=UPI0016032F3A|nr:LodA/GoxA family CTQ-dependent oxidase [Pseudoalteromonas sp. SG41-5]MBB1467525.1 lysine-epsilon oxidase [Pseudoalteromonas sp. SG41-5]